MIDEQRRAYVESQRHDKIVAKFKFSTATSEEKKFIFFEKNKNIDIRFFA